jgi:ABC-type transporter MlaC component
VKGSPGQYRVVDIATEGSSTVKNYYDQFHKKLLNPALGYDDIVKSMKKKLAEP